MAKGAKKGWKKFSNKWKEKHKDHMVIPADHSTRVGYVCLDCREGASISITNKKTLEKAIE